MKIETHASTPSWPKTLAVKQEEEVVKIKMKMKETLNVSVKAFEYINTVMATSKVGRYTWVTLSPFHSFSHNSFSVPLDGSK